MTQRKGNRNLSKRLPKRFGYFDLAIESPWSQVGASLIDLNRRRLSEKSAAQHAFLALQQQFCFKRRCLASKVVMLDDHANNRQTDSKLKAL
ncbi:hypothetical protein LB535_05545 [Mesorhizobium sp. CA10]|uniref:hypothetical protein n=1 Tax=Mesorhizobium sp. CA10 TaxID=588495 RepID=UPI001CCBC1C6|nr:hypothetical protein [Mesorhizobium sp. CA10]MBZ9881811.1 hypothetical protein [Mesorhizobium sp. CA10]